MNRKDCDKRIIGRAIFPAAIAAMCASSAAAETVSVWSQAVVTGDDVTLRDVCRLTGFSSDNVERFSELIVGDAPPAGGSSVLSIDQVRRTLEAAGANMASVVVKGATVCNVTRPKRLDNPRSPSNGTAPAEPSPHRMLRDAVHALLTAELGRPGTRVEVRFGHVDDQVLNLSEPEYTFDIRRTSGQSFGLIGLEVNVIADGKSVQTVPMLVEAVLTKPVVVAARAINLGQTIGDADVRVVEMSFTRADDTGLSDTAAVIGQRAKRYIPAAEPILVRYLEPVPLVKRGQVVDVYSRFGGVAVTTAALALEEGAYGDVVALRTTDRNRKKFTATVAGMGRVEIRAAQSPMSDRKERLALGGDS